MGGQTPVSMGSKCCPHSVALAEAGPEPTLTRACRTSLLAHAALPGQKLRFQHSAKSAKDHTQDGYMDQRDCTHISLLNQRAHDVCILHGGPVAQHHDTKEVPRE
eukprot:2854195-Amphidinium_carterae.1